jgi:hypothetical protein
LGPQLKTTRCCACRHCDTLSAYQPAHFVARSDVPSDLKIQDLLGVQTNSLCDDKKGKGVDDSICCGTSSDPRSARSWNQHHLPEVPPMWLVDPFTAVYSPIW